MQLPFVMLPVGIEFWRGDSRWLKTSETKALLIRKSRKRRTPKQVSLSELVTPVGGTQALLQTVLATSKVEDTMDLEMLVAVPE